MPRKRSHVPSYRLHKPSGQARVIINGQHIYLGRYGSRESREKYSRLIAELATSPGPDSIAPAAKGCFQNLTIDELILAYWRFAETYYTKDGEPTKELACMREALRPVRKLYGGSRACDFGPKAFKVVMHHMVELGLSHGLINHRASRIKRVFKWAVAEELIPPSVHYALQAVAGLRYGRTEAHEAEPIRPVKDMWVEAVLPHLSPQVAAMISIQRLTGMRPGEVVVMKACNINTANDIWIYEPYEHKNRWREKRRRIPLGPKTQELLKPFLARGKDAYLFSPREADAWHKEHRLIHCKTKRKTPVYPSELRARQTAKLKRRKRKSKRPKGEHYTTDSYRRAIDCGFMRAKKAEIEIPHWFPLQLRHSRATEIRRDYGLDAAQVVLGHARADVTEIYAEKNLALAIQIAREAG
jgi:integrase